MAPSTTCSHGGIVEGLLCQCPAPGEHSGPYRWDGRGLVPGWDRTGTPAVPCDGQPARDRLPRLCGFAPICRVGDATPPLTTLRAPPCAPHPAPRASVPLPRAPGRCSSAPTAAPRARRLLGPAASRPGDCRPGCLPTRAASWPGCFPARRSTAARCSPLPAAASCRPAVLSRPSRLLRHSAYLLSPCPTRLYVLRFRSSAAESAAAGVPRGAVDLLAPRVPSYGERASTARSARLPALHPGECPRARFPWSERWGGVRPMGSGRGGTGFGRVRGAGKRG